jgi:hypothetical protein
MLGWCHSGHGSRFFDRVNPLEVPHSSKILQTDCFKQWPVLVLEFIAWKWGFRKWSRTRRSYLLAFVFRIPRVAELSRQGDFQHVHNVQSRPSGPQDVNTLPLQKGIHVGFPAIQICLVYSSCLRHQLRYYGIGCCLHPVYANPIPLGQISRCQREVCRYQTSRIRYCSGHSGRGFHDPVLTHAYAVVAPDYASAKTPTLYLVWNRFYVSKSRLVNPLQFSCIWTNFHAVLFLRAWYG